MGVASKVIAYCIATLRATLKHMLPTPSLKRYLERAHYLLSLEYRGQIGRLAEGVS